MRKLKEIIKKIKKLLDAWINEDECEPQATI